MPNPTVPDFTELGARKLAELQANGYRITGYCFERQVEGTQPQRGFVDFAGFVGWWRPDMQSRKPLTDEQLWASDMIMSLNADFGWHMDTIRMFTRAIEDAHGITAHGVADMKGGQDGPTSPPVQSQA